MSELELNDEWEDAAASSAGRCGGRSGGVVGIAFHKDKAGKSPVRFSVRVRLGKDVTKAMRWMTGDRMWLQISKARDRLRISRVADEHRGWKLLGTNTGKPSTGVSCTSYFKATVNDDTIEALFPNGSDDFVPCQSMWQINGNAIDCYLPGRSEP